VFFWFIGTAVISVGLVFRDPRFDYRLLIVGSVLPVGEGVFGGARVLHGLVFSVLLLAVIVLATSGRKPIRKVLLGLPIGMILHLVFDGAWNDTEVFWWPFFGWSFDDAPLPVVDRGAWSLLLVIPNGVEPSFATADSTRFPNASADPPTTPPAVEHCMAC
jgi:hypothetical protein